MSFLFLEAPTPDDSGPLRKTPWMRSYGKQVIDLTELRGSWNVAYIYNKESLCKASQHHLKELLLGRAICAERRKTVHFCNWRDNSLGGVRKCSAVVVLVEVSLTRKRVHARLIVSSVNIVFEDSRGAQVGYTGALCILLSTQHSTAPVP